MGWPPAVVIVVRHGARLDAADKQWHLTSPTPYDPPLTYGGWNQSKALGARIASILRSRETDDEVPSINGGDYIGAVDTRKRRHKVIIHTSPFLRCVQTSVAISAGLAQNPGHTQRPSVSTSHSQSKIALLHSSPRTRPSNSTDSPNLAPIPEPALEVNHVSPPSENLRKSTVRVDAFLGEWLSPDYFEHITPPPSSVMMVAGAKADLLRREDYSNLTQITHHSPSPNVGFPGGWGSPVVSPLKNDDETPLSALPSLGQALPRRDRTSSLSSVGSNGSRQRTKSPGSLALLTSAEHGIYQPPVPNYSVSSSEQIPPGYVAHARDACVDVDYQWDSMREPLNWGNGGEYGEEWSSMHKRFRRGLQKAVDWYKQSDDAVNLMTKRPTSPANLGDVEDLDQDTDLVLILVTHGAGCNALIGALTNQPVLLDVGMSSLTMAVRKPSPSNTPVTTPGTTPKSHSRANSRNLTLSEQYDVKLVANTEHLRTSSVSTPTTSRNASTTTLGVFRERFTASGSDGQGFGQGKLTRTVTTSGNFGSIRRAASIASPGPRGYVPSRQSSVGLWSAPVAPEEEVAEEDDMILNFGDEADATPEVEEEPETEKEKEKEKDEEDEIAPLGLWGSPRPPGIAEKIREIAPKRRWTVSERG